MRLLTIILIFLSVVANAIAQDNDIYTSYGIDDGLPQSSVWSIAQDKNGFLWVGTSDGVARFDGYNFNIYRNNPKDARSIVGGTYLRFYTDSSGMLWAISQHGICIYNDNKDNFTTIFSYNDQYTTESYNCIFGEDAQYIWAGITACGLLKIDKHTHKVTVIKNAIYQNPAYFVSWQNGLVSNGKIWISGTDATCYIYDIKTGKLYKPDVPKIYTIADYNSNEVIATVAEGLITINKNSLLYKPLPLALTMPKDDRIKVIHSSSGSEMLLGCGYGLIYTDTSTWKVKKFVKSFAENKKHSFANVQCIYKDRSGNLWIGTNGDGLKKLTAPYKKFKTYSSYNDSSNLVKTLCADKQHLYVGYFGNGLEIFDKEKGLMKNVPLKFSNHNLKHIYALTLIKGNTLLLNIADENIAYSYNLSSNRLNSLSDLIAKAIPGCKAILNNNPFFLNTGNIVYAGLADYLISFDVNDAVNIKPAIVHRFAGEILTCAFKDSKGRIWAGSINGAFYLEGNEAKQIALPEVVHVKSINEDAKGDIWIGTIKGIYIIDRDGKVVSHYTEANGLSNHFVYGILKDDDGNMWFSHNKGLSVYKPATKIFRHYTNEDGLQSNEFNTGAYCKADDGSLFFGGINGTNGFNPREIVDNPNAPHVKVTHIKLFDKDMKMDNAYWNVHSITLPYDQNSLSFEFAALEYTNPKQNQYAYMMDGMDNGWINAGDKRFTRYAAMSPGEYTFKIKASNNDGIWQDNPTVISITIIPPFWLQLWFRIVCFIFFTVCIAGIILWIQKQRYRRKMRALELQQKIQMERERISRDLHDNVGTQLSLISNNIEWVEHPLKAITESEKANKLHFVNQTARDIITTLRETIWALNKEQISIEEFSDKLKAFVQKQLAIYPEIELQFTEHITETTVLGPSEALNLFRICQEAIANTLKYAIATCITIDIVSTGNNKYKVSITDDGIGFDISGVDTSIKNGLENMKYRVRDIDCTLDIVTAMNKGTKVMITKK